jgi:hypothetical protein
MWAVIALRMASPAPADQAVGVVGMDPEDDVEQSVILGGMARERCDGLVRDQTR